MEKKTIIDKLDSIVYLIIVWQLRSIKKNKNFIKKNCVEKYPPLTLL